MTTEQEPIIGIDLGTTNSAVATIVGRQPRIIPIQGHRIMPSVVGLSGQGRLLVGYPARNQWVLAPERTVRSIKRKMGSDEKVRLGDQMYTPQEISALILREIKKAAEAYLGRPVERAVITVPAYFTEPQRQATIEAGELAGLRVERILNEPTAAALAYGLGRDVEDEYRRILVYDLGGGTFDISLIELDSGVIDVMATAGDNYLGGDDFDRRLAERLAEEFREEHGIDLEASPSAWARLLDAAERAKIELSDRPLTTVMLEYLVEDADGNPLHLEREVSRYEFQELIRDLLERTLELTRKALADAQLEPEDIDEVILVGGSTRIPAVRAMLTEFMGRDPHGEIDPDLVVALGAAVQAAIIADMDLDTILVDVTPHSLGIRTARIDFTGMVVDEDLYSVIIPRNTVIPVEKAELYTTLYPGQTEVMLEVYQGEHTRATQNTLLGTFSMQGLRPNRADGRTDVLVTFRLDTNGILHVTAADAKGKLKVEHEFKASRARLSPTQIETGRARLLELEMAAPQVELSPMDRALVMQAETVLARPGLPEDLRQEIRQAVDALHRAYGASEAGDEAELEAVREDLADLLLEVELGSEEEGEDTEELRE